MTEEGIEAEYWAHHYTHSKVQEEYDDDNENASSDYLAQITREAEEAEAAEAAAAAAESENPNDWGAEE